MVEEPINHDVTRSRETVRQEGVTTNPNQEDSDSDDDDDGEHREGLEEEEEYESANSDQGEEETVSEEELGNEGQSGSEDTDGEVYDHPNQTVTRSGRVVQPNNRYCCPVWGRRSIKIK